MKTLLLLRHAKSDWDDPELSDHDRPLNKRGKRDAKRIGRLLQEEELLPDVVLTSTAKRARRTVEGVTKTASYRGKIRTLDELYLAGPEAYVTTVRALPDSYERVMVVGHNPGLEELVAQLTGTETQLPTAALVQIELPIEHWRELREETRGQLERVWRPRELT